MSDKTITYAQSGVDIAQGDALVERIAPIAARTRAASSLGALGGFGGLFDLRALEMVDPVLVAATDGVGSKLEIAAELDQYTSIGQDLVAMCVNDLLCQNARPLFFLDYLAVHSLDVERAAALIEGIAAACSLAGCELIGGETAEMPSIYPAGKFDLAGFAVGAAERSALLPRTGLQAGASVVGVASSGLHANGYALIQAALAQAGLSSAQQLPSTTANIGTLLLEPTHIYAPAALRAAEHVQAYAHITGGGLLGNISRVLPPGLGLSLDLSSVPAPALASFAIDQGLVSAAEAYRVWNMGIGFVALVNGEDATERTMSAFADFGSYLIGTVTANPEQSLADAKFQL